MKNKMFTRAHLLATLRKGPLKSKHWRSVASSAKSLQVRIHILRNKGYEIKSRRIDNILRDNPGPKPVEYILISEPVCPMCGRH